MENINEKCNGLLQNSFESNLALGRIALDSLLSVMPNETDEQKNMSHWIIVGFCFAVIASDGEISEKETEFFNQLMSTNYDVKTIKEKLAFFDKESQSLIESVGDYKDSIKDNFLLLAMVFAAADGKITKEEIEILEKINNKE